MDLKDSDLTFKFLRRKPRDFGLQDSFCDSTDLKASWERTMMPAPLLTFLAALFKVPKHKHFRSSVKDLEDLLQHLEDEEDKPAEYQVPQQQQSTQEKQPSYDQQKTG